MGAEHEFTGHADLDSLQEGGDNSVIQGKRTLGEGLVAENHQPDLVIRPALDKLLDDLLGHLQTIAPLVDWPIRIQIERLHASRCIEHQDNIDTLGADLSLLTAGLRSGHGEKQQGDGENPEPLNEAPDHGRFTEMNMTLPMLLGVIASIWITAAFAEEVIVRGFLMERVARVMGGGRFAWIASLLFTSVGFGFLHYYQGPTGIVSTGLMGLLLGALYLVVRRNLWVSILAHGLIDTIGLTALYLGLA